MKNAFKEGYLPIARLLLYLFIFGFLSCSSLKNGNNDSTNDITPFFQVAIKESDFSLFNERIQPLGLVAVDFQPARVNRQNGEVDGYWITFRFMNRRSYLAGSSAIMSTGIAHQISYQY